MEGKKCYIMPYTAITTPAFESHYTTDEMINIVCEFNRVFKRHLWEEYFWRDCVRYFHNRLYPSNLPW